MSDLVKVGRLGGFRGAFCIWEIVVFVLVIKL